MGTLVDFICNESTNIQRSASENGVEDNGPAHGDVRDV